MNILGPGPKKEARPWTTCRGWWGVACDYVTKGFVVVPCPAQAHVRESRVRRGLIFGLIRLRSPTFIGVRINAAMQVADVNGIQRTTIQTTENRKVGWTRELYTDADEEARGTAADQGPYARPL